MAVNVEVLNSQGKSAGSLEVSDALLAHPERPGVVRVALDCFMANQRQGSANTKTRGEVRGGGAKPWRQKGTGRARAGSSRSPLWVGGGTTFGPRPRSYNQRINRKARKQALLSVLSSLQREKRLLVLDSIELPEPKTREFVALRERLGVEKGRKLYVLTESVDANLRRATDNLGPNSDYPTVVRPMNNMNIFNLLYCDFLVTTTGVIKALEEIYK